MQEFDVLKIVIERLDKSEIKYMLTGSTALSFYARPRMTRDIDMVVEITGKDADKVYELFKEDFYRGPDSFQALLGKRFTFRDTIK